MNAHTALRAANAEIIEHRSELPINGAELSSLQEKDEALIRELATKNHNARLQHARPHETGLSFYNADIASMAHPSYTTPQIEALEAMLHAKNTIAIPTIERTITVDGKPQDIRIMLATKTGTEGAHHGDMSEIWYLRDQAQAAIGLIRLGAVDTKRYAAEAALGKDLLISLLHVMSTESQLKRFDTCTKLGWAAKQADWPHISIRMNDLEAKKPNRWRNKQDSFQMIADATLESMQLGVLKPSDLLAGHKQFLGAIAPMLIAVEYPTYESSGSWEELEAVRTSVMAVETSLLERMHQLTSNEDRDDWNFLQEGLNQASRYLQAPMPAGSFNEVVHSMMFDGLRALGQRLPFESPEYTAASTDERIKYREADAALTYVLMYRIPELMEQYEIPVAHNSNQPMTHEAIEDLVIAQLYRLQDPSTAGLIRYEGDSYQRVAFHTNSVQLIIRAIKDFVSRSASHPDEINLVKKQHLRNQYTPQGRSAAWIHPIAQFGSWAAERSLSEAAAGRLEAAKRYQERSIRALNCALANITGAEEYSLSLDKNGTYTICRMQEGEALECRLYQQHPDTHETFIVGSAHSPLNWAAAAIRRMVGMIGQSVRSQEKNTRSRH